MLSRLIHNAVNSYLTSLAGTIVGLPDIIDGIATHNLSLLIKGIGELLVGLAANEHKN